MSTASTLAHSPLPGDETETTRLVIVTDHRAFYTDPRHPVWSSDSIHDTLHWAVIDSEYLGGADCLLFVPNDTMRYERLTHPTSFFDRAWSQFASEWSMANLFLDLDVVFYHNCDNLADKSKHGFGYSDGVGCTVNLFAYEFDFAPAQASRLPGVLRHFGFDISEFLSAAGDPQWHLLRSNHYDEIVVIDDIDEGPRGFRITTV